MLWLAINALKVVSAIVLYEKVVRLRRKHIYKFKTINTNQLSKSDLQERVVAFPTPANKKALCIGINYTKTAHELKGCINDAMCIKNVLVSQYGFGDANIRLLADTDGFVAPTRKNILAAISWLVRDSVPGDVLFFSYSGHGTKVKDTNNDEEDGNDEAIYTLDGSIIIDDELHAELMAKIPKGVRLVCIFDCCHSGTISDLKYCFRYTPLSPKQFSLNLEKNKDLFGGDITVFSACLDPQTAADSNFNGKWVKSLDGKMAVIWGEGNGAFTWYFLETLKNSKYNITNDELLKQTVTLLQIQKFTQEAQFTSTNADLFTKPFAL